MLINSYSIIYAEQQNVQDKKIYKTVNSVCPTCYRSRHFFNNFTTNEDIATILQHTLDTSLFISHTTKHTPVQISLQYLL